MAEVGVGTVSIRPDLDGFNQGALSKGIDPAIDGAGKGIKSKFGSVFSSVAKLGGGLLAAQAVGGFFKGALDEGREAAKIGAITEQVIKTTGGAANVTADQIGTLSTKLSNLAGVDDEVIQGGANMLLTFTNVKNAAGAGNDVFDRTLGLANDMSVALGSDLSGASMQLGKALNDPIRGVGALSRVGVSFTAQQKDQIATMVSAGDTLGAQGVILDEVGKQFGGAAEAAATPTDRLKVTMGNLQETVGTLLIPVIDKLATVLGTVATWMTENQGPTLVIAGIIGTVLVAAFVAWAISAGTAAVATLALAAPLVLAAAPFIALGLVIVGLALLVTKNFDSIVSFITGIPGRISSAASGMFDGIKDAFKGAVNWIIKKWNDLELKIGGQKVDLPLGQSFTIPTVKLQTPNIPVLHDGGIYRAPRVGGEGLALLQDGERVSPAGAAGGPIAINVNGSTDVDALAEQVARTLEWRRLSGAGR